MGEQSIQTLQVQCSGQIEVHILKATETILIILVMLQHKMSLLYTSFGIFYYGQ